MRQHPIPGIQQHRGLADRKVVPDLIAVREVSDRELSDANALELLATSVPGKGRIPYH